MNAQDCQQETERIVMEWQGPVYGLAQRVLGNAEDAADATQEVFLSIFRSLETFDRSRPLKPWVFRIAANHLQNCIRFREARRRREAACMREVCGRQEPDPLERLELARQVELGLARLHPADRLLILLHYVNDLPQTEIAAALSVPRSTVQSRLERALGQLRRGLAPTAAFGALVSLESALCSLPSPPVPAEVTASLLSPFVPSGGLLAAGASTTLMGGILMSKKLVVAAIVACSCFAGSAYWMGGQGTRRAEAVLDVSFRIGC